MLEMLLPKKPGANNPVGQVQWSGAGGSYDWTCPDDVFSVCCLIVSAGQNSNGASKNWKGGFGGGVRYQNDIPTIPGQVYRVTVGTAGVALAPLSSSAFGITAGYYDTGTPLGAPVFGGRGGYPGNGTNGGYGGNSATLSNGGLDPGASQNPDSVGGLGISLLGVRVTSSKFAQGCDLGGGGSGQAARGGYGGVRIIWGPSRAYPNTNITDK